MSDVTLGNTVTLVEATDMIQHVGEDVTFLFSGEMGIGKSAMLRTLERRMGDAYRYMYCETQTFDVGDISGVPFTELVNGVKVTRFAPNVLTGVHSDKPIIFMADEVGKATRPVQNTLLRLFQSKAIGEYALPKGSIVFGTTNLAVEGLGDYVQHHAENRVSAVEVAKPTATEWLPWAMANDIHPVILAWVKRFPHCLASFRDGDGNPYIFYPSKTVGAFVSPRSLENASHILFKRGKLTDNATAAGVRGCVGAAAMGDIMTFAQTYDRLPSWEATVTDPSGCAIPSKGDFAASFVTVFSAISMVEKNTFSPFMTYLKRLPKEYQGVFALNVLTSPKRDLALSNRPFIDWATENHYLV